MDTDIPRYIVWSIDHVDLDDPFQRRWWLRQVLMHGRAEDIQKLDFDEIESVLDQLRLPPAIDRLWRSYFNNKNECQ